MLLRNSTGKGVGMAIRTRAVYPDTGYVLPSGEQIAIVSEETLVDEAVAMLRVAYRVGGIVSVVQDRAQTGVPHEMVTVAAVVQWQDRTDAKPQPEPAVEPVPAAEDYAEAWRCGRIRGLRARAADDDWQDELAGAQTNRIRWRSSRIRSRRSSRSGWSRRRSSSVRRSAMRRRLSARRRCRTGVRRGSRASGRARCRSSAAASRALRRRSTLPTSCRGAACRIRSQVPRPSDAKAEFQFDDGLRESSLEEEDDSSIPENLR
jgi:hypothetical protein